MAYTYSTFTIRDLGAGIDQQSSEDSIKEGYCELLLNADPEPMGYVSKRLGYQRTYGQLPVRISKVEYSTGSEDNLCFFLDSEVDISSIDLLSTRRTPLVIQGRTSPQNTLNEGDFPNDSNEVRWYPTFNADVESVFAEGSNTIANAGIGTEHVFVHTSKRANNNDKSNSVFLPDEVRIDTTDGSVTVSYDNNTGDSFEGYIYLSDKTPTPGTTYTEKASDTVSIPGGVIAEGLATYTIPTSAHALSNFNIDTRIYRIDGTDYVEVRPEKVEIASNGDVSFDIQNDTGSTFDAAFYLTAYPVANSVSDTILPADTATIQLTGLTTPFVGAVIYLDDDPASAANPIRQVWPESIEVDDVSKTATVTFQNQSATSKRFTIYWESVSITSNKLCVTASEVTSSFTDTEPQLTIWGLDHQTIYGLQANSTRPGWVTHLDSYKSEGENKLVAGLGGNLFTESDDASSYLLPTAYPNLNGRCASDTNIGPATYTATTYDIATGDIDTVADTITLANHGMETDGTVTLESTGSLPTGLSAVMYAIVVDSSTFQLAASPGGPAADIQDVGTGQLSICIGEQSSLTPSSQRTRGWIEFTTAVDNFAQISTITWQSGTSVKYVLKDKCANSGPITNIISTTINEEDYLTVKNAPNSKHNGTFKITAAAFVGTTVELTVENPNVNCAAFDVTSSTARGAILTDQVPLLSTSQFQVGDELESDLFTYASGYEVVNSIGSTITISEVSGPQLVPAGLLLVARRTSNIFPIRTIGGTPSTTNFVAYDSVTYSDVERKLTALYVSSRDDEAVTITGDGTTATIQLPTPGSTNINYAIGQTILLNQAGSYTGAQVITGIPDAKQLEFTSTSTDVGVAGTLVGHTIVFDETTELRDSIDNSIELRVDKRWVPIEAPVDNFDKTRKTYTQHFDTFSYAEQPYLKSTMVSDNLYLTNGADEVMKYDGVNLYRAGLFRWQPQLFITVAEGASNGNIQVSLSSSQVNVATGNSIELDDGEETKWAEGDVIRDNAGTEYVVLRSFSQNDAGTQKAILELNNSYTGVADGSTFVEKAGYYRYYFRLNAIDVNNNLIGSALTGIEDTVVKVYAASQIRIRLVGMPAWDIYDYDRLEVEIYRTTLSSPGSYRRIVTLPMRFNNDDAYIDFADDTNDDLLLNQDKLDIALTGGIGSGTQFAEPMRASYITSAGNRLVLANLVDYPELSIQYESNNLGIADLAPTEPNNTAADRRYLFRKDNTDVATASDLENRQGYEFVPSKIAVEGITNSADFISANVDDVADTITITSHLFNQDDQVELTTAGTLPDGLETSTTYYVLVVDANTIQLSLTESGTAVDFQDAGVGTHTIIWQNQFTVSSTFHNLNPGNWVYLFHSNPIGGYNTFSTAEVHVGTDQLEINGHPYSDGEKVVLAGGTLPTPFVEGTPYYVIVVDANHIQLTDSYGGSAIDITAAGSGPHTISYYNTRSLQYAGWFQIASKTTNDFTIVHKHTETAYIPSLEDVDSYAVATSKVDIPVYLGLDRNYDQSSYNPDGASPNFDYTEVALVRLANAINTSMRYASSPWMTAGAGGDFGVGQLVIRQPKVEQTFLEVQLPAYSVGLYRIFVNSVGRAPQAQASARTQLYPSRLIFSENNFPEVFLNPRATSDLSQDTYAVDVNSADGEQITGVIPFFGDSAFGSAQKDGVLVVFKESSIYLVNLQQKVQGGTAVQRLESQGLGCTAPRSIAVTRDGIIFANRSGIYKLTRDLRIEYVGQKVERLWETDVNRSALDEAVGHHYSVGRQYKLSYPIRGESENSKVFTYNHTREYQQQGEGSWTSYDNHPATWWTNLLTDAYFSTTSGAVMKIRTVGDETDFRDDASAINMEVTFRALDFGDAGIRKVIGSVLAHFRNAADMESTQLLSALNLSPDFEALDNFKVVKESDKVVSLQFAVGKRKGLYFQIKMTNSAIDEPVELTSIDVRVAGLRDTGVRSAANTTG